MLNVDANTGTPVQRVTMCLEPEEAEELIAKLRYLLDHPEYHHDHVECDESVLDILIIEPAAMNSYHSGLQLPLQDYLARRRRSL